MTKKSTAVIKRDNIVSPVPAQLNNEEYAELLHTTFEASESFRRTALGFYWQLGTQILKLVGQERTKSYGKKLLQAFASDLFANYGLQLGVKSLYHAGRIRKALSKEDLDLALEGRMGLEATLELCKESVPAATRKQLLEQNQQAVASGKKFDVRDALRTQTGDGGGSDGSSSQSSSGPPANPLKGVKHMSKFFMMVESKIVSVGDCVETICRDSDVDKIKAVREAFEDACTSFDNLVDTWKSQVAQSTKALQTVKSVK